MKLAIRAGTRAFFALPGFVHSISSQGRRYTTVIFLASLNFDAWITVDYSTRESLVTPVQHRGRSLEIECAENRIARPLNKSEQY
jgi:hypothetical protein